MASLRFFSEFELSSILDTISNLLEQISNVKDRAEALWTTRHDKLQAYINQRMFQKEASKVSYGLSYTHIVMSLGWGWGEGLLDMHVHMYYILL